MAPLAASKPTIHLPYKFVIFKNSFPEGDWDPAEVFAFDLPSIPSLQNTIPHIHTVSLLPGFCNTALKTLQRYLSEINNDVGQTPTGCKWIIHTIDIERDESGVLSCREFGVVLELVGWKTLVGNQKAKEAEDRNLQAKAHAPVPQTEDNDLLFTMKRADPDNNGQTGLFSYSRSSGGWVRRNLLG
ncbi:hypothetical protein TWF281_011684 [Arthrobotrys megalospora]